MTWFIAKLLIRLAVFTGVFAFAARKNPKVEISPKWALPLVGLVFGLLNVGLYWLLKPVVSLATLGAFSLLVPLVLNGAFLWATSRVLRPLRIRGAMAMVWLSVILTAAHGLLYLALDVLAA